MLPSGFFPVNFFGNTLKWKGEALPFLRSVERRSKARGYFSKWPIILRCGSSISIEMFCKPCYAQGGTAILRQMKKEMVGKVGKEMERLWKRISNHFPSDFRSFNMLKNRVYAKRITFKSF